MLGQTIRSATGLIEGVLGLVNTGLSAGVCGLNTLNQEIKEIAHPQQPQLTEAQKFLQQPSMAIDFIRGNSSFNKVVIEPEKKYQHIFVYEDVIAFGLNETIYKTNIDKKYYKDVINMMYHAKNILNYLEIKETGKADRFTLTNGKQSVILWDNLSNEHPDQIKDIALLVLIAIEEVNQ